VIQDKKNLRWPSAQRSAWSCAAKSFLARATTIRRRRRYVARVYRWSPPDFEPTTIAAGLDFVQALARDETHLYWIDDTFGELRLYRIEF
jgi:hypothetical protein